MVETGTEATSSVPESRIVTAAGEKAPAGGRKKGSPRGSRERKAPPTENETKTRAQPDRATLERLRSRLKRQLH